MRCSFFTQCAAIALFSLPLLALGTPLTTSKPVEFDRSQIDGKEAHGAAIEVRVAGALVLVEEGNPDAAEQLLESLRESNPNSPVPILGQVAVAMHQGLTSEAQERLNDALKIAPEDWRVPSAFANFHRALGQDIDAERWLKKAIALAPKLAKLRSDLGDLYIKLKRYPEAVSEYAEALRLDSSYVHALISRGNVLLLLNQPGDALADFDAAVRLAPKSANVQVYRGMALEAAGKHDEAISAYQLALELEPDSPIALNNLGWLMLSSRDDLQQAEDYARRAVELAPNVAGFHDTLASVYRAQGRSEEAQQQYRKAIELDPTLESSATALRELSAPRATSGQSP